MKHIFNYSLSCILLAATSLGLVSCSDDDENDIPAASYPASVELIIPENLHQYIYTDKDMGVDILPMIKGESLELEYSISPVDVTFDDVIWSSNNESVATVDQNGKVTAVSGDGLGYAIVQVAPDPFFAGSNIFGTLRVNVSNVLIPAQSIDVSSVNNEEEVFIGETLQLTVSILPEDATYKTVKWSSSDENLATVDNKGLVTAKSASGTTTVVTITATSLDGAQVLGSKQITLKQIIVPEDVTIDQGYSVDNGYVFAITDKKVSLNYTTVPAVSTASLIEWETSNSSIATVDAGVVTFNQAGVFGDVTITATCSETGNTSSIKLHLAEGLIRELFLDPDNYTWANSSSQAGTSHELLDGKIRIKTYTVDETTQRADFICLSTTSWVHAGNYPIFAIRMDDVADTYDVTRNITFDGANGSCNGETYSGGLNGNNNKWLHDYKCSDGSHVFIYDLSTQKWASSSATGILPDALASFKTLQFKYADIKTLSHQVTYDVYWVQTFKTLDDLKAYIASEGLTYDIIK